jgi:hypothetical protein
MKLLVYTICACIGAIIPLSPFAQDYDKTGTAEHVSYEGSSEPGTITVTSTAFAKKGSEARIKALTNTFRVLLFTGLPGSQYDRPMLNDEASRTNPLLATFLDKGINAYIIAEEEIESKTKKTKIDKTKGVFIGYRLTINCAGVHQELIRLKIIRKFGI